MRNDEPQNGSSDLTVRGFQVEGRAALGFDTGLDPVAFAQAKLVQLLSEPGYLVSGTGEVAQWRAEGVAERDGRMVVWGPAFDGERLDRSVDRGGYDALEALRSWIAAREALRRSGSSKGTLPAPYPAASFVGADGAVLFAPERLALRSLDAAGAAARLDGAERWVHPDLSGEAAEGFAAGALAYRIFSGNPPFGSGDADSVRSDMRDARVLPAGLARPGLDDDLASLIDAAIAVEPPGRAAARRPAAVRPSIRDLSARLGPNGAGGVDRFVLALTEEERAAVDAAAARRSRSSEARIGAKRFARKNATIIAAAAAAAIGVFFIARSIIAGRADLPTTAGMTAGQVVEAYYAAFGTLDHTFMEASVTDKAGAGDISAAMNLFVITRVRQAYERQETFMSAQDWIAQGSKPVSAIVFGVAGLSVERIASDDAAGTAVFRARYSLWMPSSGRGGPQEEAGADSRAPLSGSEIPQAVPQTAPPPVSERREDTLTVVLRRGLWRISEIDRRVLD